MALSFYRALTFLALVRLKPRKPREGSCARRARLLRNLIRVLEEELVLYRRQKRAIENGDVLFKRLDRPIESCAAKLKGARNAYWRHIIRRHGC